MFGVKMIGLYGYIKNNENKSQLGKMQACIKKYKKPTATFEYSDNCCEIFQYSLNLYQQNYINNENILLAIEGRCYNLQDLNEKFSSDYKFFSDAILGAYSQDKLKELLNKVDGCFHFCLYDKKNKKIIIANDRFGLMPLFIYTKDNNFAFGAEAKSLLPLDFVNVNINKDALNVFYHIGYLLGDNTWFDNIKKMKPATIIEYNVSDKTIKNEHYWTFGEVKKSNISFEDAVDKAYDLFLKSIKKQVDMNYKYIIPLSGGFDSRLIVACLKKIYPDYKPYIVTFGTENCQDMITAEKICIIANLEHHKKYFDENTDWFHSRYDFIYDCDGAFSMRDMHGLEFLKTYPDDLQIIINGYLGDTIFGKTYLPKNKELWDSQISLETAQFYYGDYAQYSNYDDEYFNIENPIPLQWLNRGNNFVNEAQRLCFPYFDVIRPFMDNDLIEFVASLPNEYLAKDKLYNHLGLKHLPTYFKIPRNSEKPICIKNDWVYMFKKIKFSLTKILLKCHILHPIRKNYVDYANWIKESNLDKEIHNLLLNKNAVLNKFLDSSEVENLFKSNDYSNILRLTSIEIYFKQIDKILKQSNDMAETRMGVERESNPSSWL